MAKSIKDIPKKRGRPPTGGRGEGIMVRMQPDQLAALDAWIERQGEATTRPKALRRLAEIGLSVGSPSRRRKKLP
jgi:hypothetical protein